MDDDMLVTKGPLKCVFVFFLLSSNDKNDFIIVWIACFCLPNFDASFFV